jgi:molecular chaperone GrpE
MDTDDNKTDGTHSDSDNTDGPVKVVDRRWWTAGGTGADASAGHPRKPSYVEGLEQQLEEKDKAIQAHAQRYRESATEFEQVRARLRRDLDKEIERARRAILVDFLDVADNLDRALAAAGSTPSPDPTLLRGVQLVRDLFLSKLAGYQVARMNAEGQAFDPNLHDAVSTVSVASPALDDHIVAVIRNGYTIGESVLRPAVVAVGRHDASPTEGQSSASPAR